MDRWDRWPTRVASGNAAGRLPRGKPDEGEPHVRFGKGELETGRKLPRLLPTSRKWLTCAVVVAEIALRSSQSQAVATALLHGTVDIAD